MSLLVTSIQRSSFYDGPGIRTTVFLKGCSLKCPWCCNPENISSNLQIYFNEKKCLRRKGIDCNECIKITPLNINKLEDIIRLNENFSKEFNYQKFKEIIENCPTGAIGVYGKEMKTKELIDILKKDKPFYQLSGGGVTFSGGEPLLQAKCLTKCLEDLKKENIHIAIETSLFCSPDSLNLVEQFVDLFIIDIKILDPEECKKYLKGNIEIYLENIKRILKMEKNFIFRFPAVKPYTFNESNIKLLCDFVKEWKIKNLEIFSVHNFATNKYESLGLKPPHFQEVKQNELKLLKEKLTPLGVVVKILTV